MKLIEKMAKEYATVEKSGNIDPFTKNGFIAGFRAAKEMAVFRAEQWDMADTYPPGPNGLSDALREIGEEEI